MGAAHKQANLTLVEHKSGFAVLAKVSNKSADLASRAIEAKPKPLSLRVKTLTVDSGKDFPIIRPSIRPLATRPTLLILIAVGRVAAASTSMVFYDSPFPSGAVWKPSAMSR